MMTREWVVCIVLALLVVFVQVEHPHASEWSEMTEAELEGVKGGGEGFRCVAEGWCEHSPFNIPCTLVEPGPSWGWYCTGGEYDPRLNRYCREFGGGNCNEWISNVCWAWWYCEYTLDPYTPGGSCTYEYSEGGQSNQCINL